MCACVLSHFSRVQLFAVSWTPGSSVHGILQEDWSQLPVPSPRHHPNPGMETASHFSCLAGGLFTTEPLEKPEWNKDVVLNEWINVLFRVSCSLLSPSLNPRVGPEICPAASAASTQGCMSGGGSCIQIRTPFLPAPSLSFSYCHKGASQVAQW